jgi:hypothetical protein
MSVAYGVGASSGAAPSLPNRATPQTAVDHCIITASLLLTANTEQLSGRLERDLPSKAILV